MLYRFLLNRLSEIHRTIVRSCTCLPSEVKICFMNTIWHRDVPVYLSFIAIICHNFLICVCTELCYLLIAERIITPSVAGLLVSDDTMLKLLLPLSSGN